MRKFSKHTPEQIVVKLEKAEALRVCPRKAPKPRTAPRLQRLVPALQ